MVYQSKGGSVFKRCIILLVICQLFVFCARTLALPQMATEIMENETSLKQVPVLVLNTSQKDWIEYEKPFGEIAKSIGLQIDYRSLDSVIDTPLKELTALPYKVLFVLIEKPFLQILNSSLTTKVLDVIEHYSQTNNSVVALFFPSELPTLENSITLFSSLFDKAGIKPHGVRTYTLFKNEDHPDRLFSKMLDTFLSYPPDQRGFLYHKTLEAPHGGESFQTRLGRKVGSEALLKLMDKEVTPLTIGMLPLTQDFNALINPSLPYGLYRYNSTKHNHLIVSNNILLSCSGLSENFRICPVDFELRSKLHDALTQTLWEIKGLATQGEKVRGLNRQHLASLQKPPTSPVLAKLGHTRSKSMYHHKKGLPFKTAWMEILAFEGTDEELAKDAQKTTQQKELMEYIFASKLDALWVSFAPNMYYSPIGKKHKEKDRFLQGIGRFTKTLKAEAHRRRLPIPQILIGFEISNNFTENKPSSITYDCYGFGYPTCPSPLDDTFWRNEVTQPLKAFKDDWSKKEVGNGIALSGIVLDLEMYFCQPGMFKGTMGFEPELFKAFNKASSTIKNSQEFAQYLLNEHKGNEYFSYLTHKALKLGSSLRNDCTAIIPNCIVTCYVPHVSLNWFYKGLYQGLGTLSHPILLYSFNSEFDSHKKELEKNHIYMEHSGVLMLSKLQKTTDIKPWVDHLFYHHGRVWINRFSRLAEEYKKNEWYTIEQTPLDELGKKEFTKHLSKHPASH